MRRFVVFACVLTFLGLSTTTIAQETAEAEQLSAVSLYNDGLEKMKAKNYAEGFPLLVQAIEAADTTSETDLKVIKLSKANGAIAAYYVGAKQRKADKLEEALETHELGISYNPDFYANYIGRAQALEALERDPAAVAAYVEAGDVCTKSEKADKAEKMYNKAENMIAIARKNKNWEKTQEMAVAFLDLRETADVHYYLADAMMEQGNTEEAIMHADKAIAAADGAKDKYLMIKAQALEASGDTEAAIEAYKQVGGKWAERAQYQIGQLGG